MALLCLTKDVGLRDLSPIMLTRPTANRNQGAVLLRTSLQP